MKRTFFIIILFSSFVAKAQSPYDWFNGETFWKRIVIDTAGEPTLAPGDTTIAVVSTRMMQPDSLRSVGELRDGGQLRYFFVYSSKGKWHVLRKNSLSEILRYTPDINKDWVVYTEGMGKIFTNDLDRGMQMNVQHSVNVLLLDYPSIRTDKGSLANYKFAINSARDAYKDFVPVLDSVKGLKLTGSFGTGHLSLFFHSMGNNLMREIVLHNLLFLYNDRIWVDNIILNSPCVPRRKHKQWLDKIRFAKRMYVHYNPKDGTLKWARLASFHQILGEHIKGPLSSNAIYINFHRMTGDGHSNFLWLYGRSQPPKEVMTHYRSVLHGNAADVNDRELYLPSPYRNIGYELIPAVRQIP